MNSTLPLAIVSHTLPAGWLAKLDGRCRMVAGPKTAGSPDLTPDLRRHLAEAEGLFSIFTVRVDEALLAAAPKLRVVSNMAVGVDNIDLAACQARGVAVGHTPGVLTDGTADLTVTLLLAAARRLPMAMADAKAGRWTVWEPDGWLGKDLRGATVGIVGMGSIGTAVAGRLRPFGCYLVYHTRLFDAAALRLLLPDASLVNAARGGVVDGDALLTALREGWIGAAALDVTDPEPLPPTHPLYALPNCLIAPHIGSATENTRRAMAELACDNLLAGLAGTPLPHAVSLA